MGKKISKIFIILIFSAAVALTCSAACRTATDNEVLIGSDVNKEVTGTGSQTASEELKEGLITSPGEQVEAGSADAEENGPAGDQGQVKSITPEEVYDIITNSGDYLIVDVRTEDEFNQGHIEGAMLLPVQELEDRLDELPLEKPLIVYCRSGSRSRTAADILVANGFIMVYDMGGISSWTSRGYPVIIEKD